MHTRDGLNSWRTKLEQAFAGVLFGTTALLVLAGAIAMCVQPSLLAA
ncbi:MAG: hypothetical protein ABI885_07925 [Gammaproteobacteria bacterium]